MQLTGQLIVESGIVTNVCEDGIQQQGVDVRIDKVYKVYSGEGLVPKIGKTCRPNYLEIYPEEVAWGNGILSNYFHLEPGWYEIEMIEGCNLGPTELLNFKTRSSLVRCGAIVHSGQFDAGFKTDKMGCFLHVIHPINIERGARIAQAVVTESYEVEKEDLYSGQWQGDKQRM
jgi:deoxycytidine triphosphate deaminase